MEKIKRAQLKPSFERVQFQSNHPEQEKGKHLFFIRRFRKNGKSDY
jgi:hypothetical protein